MPVAKTVAEPLFGPKQGSTVVNDTVKPISVATEIFSISVHPFPSVTVT